MKKYLLPSLLILLLFGGGIAVTRNVNKALQLSQDGTGAFGVDTNNNVYFPAHQLTTGRSPVLTSCGTSPSITGTDTAGLVVGGSVNAAGCVITFSQAYLATPYCIVASENPATSPLAFTLSTTAITIGGTNMGQARAHYVCTGSS